MVLSDSSFVNSVDSANALSFATSLLFISARFSLPSLILSSISCSASFKSCKILAYLFCSVCTSVIVAGAPYEDTSTSFAAFIVGVIPVGAYRNSSPVFGSTYLFFSFSSSRLY